MMKKKSVFWMNLVLVFALIAGLALPAANVSAAGKSKQKKVLVVYFSATGTTKSAAKKVKKATSGGSGISGSMKGIKASAKGAKVVKGKDLTDSSAKSVKKWAKKYVK